MAKSIRKNDKPRRKNDRTHRKEGGDAFTPTKATDPSDPDGVAGADLGHDVTLDEDEVTKVTAGDPSDPVDRLGMPS